MGGGKAKYVTAKRNHAAKFFVLSGRIIPLQNVPEVSMPWKERSVVEEACGLYCA